MVIGVVVDDDFNIQINKPAVFHADKLFQRNINLILEIDDAFLIKVISTHSFSIRILINKGYSSVYWVSKVLMSKYGL